MHDILDLLRSDKLAIHATITYDQYGSFCTHHGRRGKDMTYLCEMAGSLPQSQESGHHADIISAIQDLSRWRNMFSVPYDRLGETLERQ